METRCPNCGSPITLDEVTRGTCSSCNAVLPHVMRAQQQAMAFRMALGAPAGGMPPPPGLQPLPGMQMLPHAPKPANSSAVLVMIMVGVMMAMGVAGAAVFLVAAPVPTTRSTPTATTTTAKVAAPVVRACREKASLRSKESTTAVTYAVTNDTAVTMSISWIDTRGATTFYRKLGPGESYSQPSYATHPWVVDDDKGTCQGLFLAERGGPMTVYLSAVRDAR